MHRAIERLIDGCSYPVAQLAPDARLLAANAAWRTCFGGAEAHALFEGLDRASLVTALDALPHQQGGALALGAFRRVGARAAAGVFLCELLAREGGPPLLLAAREDAEGGEGGWGDARFRELIEQFPAAIGVHRDGRFLYVNPATARYLGYAHTDELAGLPITAVVHPSEYAEIQARVAHMARTGQPVAERETRLVRKDGSVVLAELGAFVIDRDRVPAYVVVARDVSERRRLEEQLRHGRRMEAIGRLAGGVAHDFNNHLSVMLNYSEFLIEALPPDGQLHREAREIHHAAQRAASLTQQLLMFSRGDVADHEVLDVNGVVRGLSEFLRRTLGADIDLVTRLGPGLPPIRGARQHVEQILVNLAVNARDATPSGGELRIETSTLCVDAQNERRHPNLAPGVYACIEFADNGVGMTPEVATRAFEPFFTTKGEGKGTGLGLSTVYGIVTHAGGDVELESERGRGTVVRILWPECATGLSCAGDDGPPVAGQRPDTVLLVEDDTAVRTLVARMLARDGFRVIEAGDAVEALGLVEDEEPELDVLVTDVVMPRMTGPELALALRSLRPGLPVVFMSGYADDVLEQHDVQSAAVTFLPKPFSARELRDKVEQARARASG